MGNIPVGQYLGNRKISIRDSTYYADFKNWGIYAIMFRYKNTQGYTDFVNGLTPDIAVSDTIDKEFR